MEIFEIAEHRLSAFVNEAFGEVDHHGNYFLNINKIRITMFVL